MRNKLVKYITAALLSLGTVSVFNQNNTVNASEGAITRISGETRYQTATNISRAGFEKSNTVFIANAMNFADALSGGPLAYQNDAPILLAHGGSLREETVKEIKRLGTKKAIILGGEAAVSKSIEIELKGLGLSTERLAGKTRFETAELIADKLGANSRVTEAVVVDGYNFADALSIGPFAAKNNMPIYLTKPDQLPNETSLKKYGKTYIVGGHAAVSETVENKLNNPTRLAGKDRFQTNLEVLNYFGIEENTLSVATGMDFADALTGSVLAAKNNTGMLLTRNTGLNNAQKNYLQTNRYAQMTIKGGPVSVSTQVEAQLGEYINQSSVKPSSSYAESIINIAHELKGVRYSYGGTTPSGFDCSGFVQYVFRQAGRSITRTTASQYNETTRISQSQAQPGDLIFFKQDKSVDHVGIYLGDGKFIGAQTSTGVAVATFTSGYWARYVAGFGRL